MAALITTVHTQGVASFPGRDLFDFPLCKQKSRGPGNEAIHWGTFMFSHDQCTMHNTYQNRFF